MALLEFFGGECPHCQKMEPLVAKLEEDLGVEVQKFETWHNEENEAKRKKYDKDCGGVPYFYNTDTEEGLCGERPYEELKAWAQAK